MPTQLNKRPSVPGILFLLSCVLFISCENRNKGNNTSETAPPNITASDTKFTQYYVKGEQLYLKNCSNCHQKNGLGLGRLYPPINNSDFVAASPDKVICIMRYGKKGELIVNGKQFNKEMQAIPSLTDLEIAQIATYIYNTWGLERGIMEVKTVTESLRACETNPK